MCSFRRWPEVDAKMKSGFEITRSVIEPAARRAELGDKQAGACVIFEGWVRDHNEGFLVEAIDYEAHVSLAEAEGGRILDEARAKFGILHCTAVHRIGRLGIEEVAVWVGVTAAHRAAAFEACRYIIEEAKKRLPVWKKEHYAAGTSRWINSGVEDRGQEKIPQG